MLVTRQPVLRRFWYALFPVSAIDDGPKPFTLLGEPIVVWKTADGTPAPVQSEFFDPAPENSGVLPRAQMWRVVNATGLA